MRNWFGCRVIVALGIISASLVGLGGCTTNPATGKRSFVMQGWDWERSVALEAGPQFTEEYGGPVRDAEARQYVQNIGERLTRTALEQAYSEVPELEWEYILLDSQVLNAFALPGGKVYISRGLAELLTNEAQLAGVLGHEVGHVMARHGNQRVSQQAAWNLGLTVGAVAVGVADDESQLRQYGELALPALTVGGQVVLLSYGRDEELEADALGIQYMVDNGYDPVGQRQVMQILGQASGGGGSPEWLSTHPASETRIRRIDAMLDGEYAHTQQSNEYGLYQNRYRERMLDRLAKLGPPKHARSGVLGHPALWCAHCREEAIASRE